MKLKDYIKNLNDIISNNPETAEYDVIYSIDSEGNEFHNIYYSPTVGYYDDGEFVPEEQFEDDGFVVNSVCVN